MVIEMSHVYAFSGDKNYPLAIVFNETTDYGRKQAAKITGGIFLEYDRETLDLESTLAEGAKTFADFMGGIGKGLLAGAEEAIANLKGDESFANFRKNFSMTPAGMFLAGYLARDDVKKVVDSAKGEVKILFDELSSCVVDGSLKLDSNYRLKDKMKGLVSQIIPYTAELSEKAYRTAVDALATNYNKLGGPLQESLLVQKLIRNFDSQVKLEISLDNGTKGAIPGPDYRLLFKELGASKIEDLPGKEVTALYKKGPTQLMAYAFTL